MALHCRIGVTDIFLSGPFEGMTREVAEATNLLLECIEDTLSRHPLTLSETAVFQSLPELQLTCVPAVFVRTEERFQHLRHLLPKAGEIWTADSARLRPDLLGVRVVFDVEELYRRLQETTNRAVEVDFTRLVLRAVADIPPRSDMSACFAALQAERDKPPRFKSSLIPAPAGHRFVTVALEPTERHFALARKRIAELARDAYLVEGRYRVDEAKEKLNTVRVALLEEIKVMLSQCSYESLLQLLVTSNDALLHDRELRRYRISQGTGMDVDYELDEALSELKKGSGRAIANHGYLIEQLIHLGPNDSSEKPTDDQLGVLLAWNPMEGGPPNMRGASSPN